MGLLVYAVLLDESGAMAYPESEFWRIIQYEATRVSKPWNVYIIALILGI